MIQLGIRLHDTAELPFEERLETVRAQGFSCVHLALSKVSGLPSATEAFTPGYAMALRHLFAKHELDVAVLGCYQNPGNPDEQMMARIRNQYLAHIRLASLLGCGVVGTETGALNEDYHYDPQDTVSEQALEQLIRNLKPIVLYAEKMGVILAIEPVWKHIVSDADRARTVLDKIGSPNLQVILDPVNLISPARYQQRDETIAHAIEVLGRDVAVIHLKDCRLEHGEVVSSACGTGELDYSQIISFAERSKPCIQATLENTTPENAVMARRYIEEREGRV